jgi:hypothetical protein
LTADPATIRASVPFANEMFYVLWIPMAAATELAFDNVVFVWVQLLHLAVFYRPAVQQIQDWRTVLRNAVLGIQRTLAAGSPVRTEGKNKG